MPDSAIINAVRQFFREICPVPRDHTIVVAVSGGPDSVCLLSVLAELREEYGFRLHVAHLNHRLRGEDSDADAAYVQALAERLDLPVTVEARDCAAYREEHKLSLEEAAREVRYAFLAGVAGETGAAHVAVGHTADDRAETVLMNLIRGTGTRGLRGLLPVTVREVPGSGMAVIRPLLEVSREATNDYCREHRLEPRLDATNLSIEPFRNNIRHRLLPMLAEYNPRITESLLRTARISAEDIDCIDAEAARLQGGVMREEDGAVILDKAALAALHPALQRYLLRAAVLALRGTLKDIESGHIEDIMAALGKPAGKVIGLPEGLRFTIEYDRYILASVEAALCPFPALEEEHRLTVPGDTDLPGWRVSARVYPEGETPDTGHQQDGFTAWLDAEASGTNLSVRAYRPGDRFQPLGLGRSKKVGEFMIDARIPRAWRSRIPLVVSPGAILWVVGWRIDDRVRIGGHGRPVLRLRFTRR